MDKERDTWDDFFRLKLQDVEADTEKDDWKSIANRLPEGKIVSFHRRRVVYWAAVVLAIFLLGGGSYLTWQTNTNIPISQPVHREPVLTLPVTPVPLDNQPLMVAIATNIPLPIISRTTEVRTAEIMPEKSIDKEEVVRVDEQKDVKEISPAEGLPTVEEQSANLLPIRKPSPQKWGFGMGMGGLMQNSGEVVNTYTFRSSNLEDEELLALNAASDQNLGKLPRTNIKHRTPVSFGLSVSRTLNNRFSLQTGLVYSLLISDWETQATAYNSKTRQTLHFVGIPLSLSYKITQWNRFLVYASVGVTTEVNIAGKLRVKRFSNDLQTGVSYINQRMEEWQWSTNMRVGISYPLIPHINAFAEIGAAYYFDNGSDMETIYSDKPLNINPQVGFRLSF
jgi:hypothetical protein